MTNDETQPIRLPNRQDETRQHQRITRHDLDKTAIHPRVEPPTRVARPAPPPPPPPPAPAPPPFVPPAPSKRKKPRRRSLLGRLIRTAIILGVLTAILLGSAVALYNIFPPNRTNILVLGVDARPGQGYVTRTDTIMLVTVDPAQPYVGILSIPRDLYVSIPGYRDGRINTAHFLGENAASGYGPKLAAQTVSQNFGVPVHRTLRMNFQGFVAIVDAAGGVDIDVPAPISDNAYPTENFGTTSIYFEAGMQHMDGERALQYARTRHSSNDFLRAGRQQQVMTALAHKLMNPLNWWRLPAVYVAFTSNVETDLTIIDAVLLAPAVLETGPDNFERVVLSRENSMVVNANIPGDPYLLAPNWSLVNPLIDNMFRR